MTMAMEGILHTYRRPRKMRARNVRRGETSDEVRAVAKAYRIKEGAVAKDALDEKWGTTIGRLLIEQSIEQEQFDAAGKYLDCVVAYARLMGIPSPHPRALDLLRATAGLSCEKEWDEERIIRTRRQFADARRALLDCGIVLGLGSDINRIVYGVVVENWPRYSVGTKDVQNLRCGLNALGRVFR